MANMAEEKKSETYPNDIIRYVKECDYPEKIKDKMGLGLLHCCIRDDKLELMEELLALGKLPINGSSNHLTPLHFSLLLNKTEFAIKLIKAGADVNIVDSIGKVLLHHVINLEGARLLLENGATATINNYNINGITPLHRAVQLKHHELVHLLLYYGAEPETVCNRGNSPFMTSLMNRDIEMQTILLEYECDFNRMSDNGCLLELAIINKSPFVLEIMNRGADIKTGNVFQWCLDTDNLESFKDFWKKKAFMTEYYECNVLNDVAKDIKYVPYLEYILETDELQEAVQHLPSYDLISQLLKLTQEGYSRQMAQRAVYIFMSYGVCVSSSDLSYIYREYKTKEYELDEFFRIILLMDVDEERGLVLILALSRDFVSLEDVRLFLENSTTTAINSDMIHGMTPLHHAVTFEYHELVHLLLYYGAETDTVSNDGSSPFITSVTNKDVEMQKILLEYECDFNRITDTGHLLELAIENESPFVLEMINRGAEIKTANVFQWCLETDNLKSFKDFWQKKAFMTEYYICDVLLAVTENIEYIPYLEYILRTDELQEAVQHLPTDDVITQLFRLTEEGYSRQMAQTAVYILLSYGVCLSPGDLYYIYYDYKTEEYEMDEFFRVILFMDIYEIPPEEDCIIPSLVFSTSTNIHNSLQRYIGRLSKETFRRYQDEIQELIRYVMHPRLRQAILELAEEENSILDENLTKKVSDSFPSLFELARNQVRHYIHSKGEIRNTSDFYTILESLPLPWPIIEVVEFRRSIY